MASTKMSTSSSCSYKRDRVYCIAIGILVGIFIQLSSLCANMHEFFTFVFSSYQYSSATTTTTTTTDAASVVDRDDIVHDTIQQHQLPPLQLPLLLQPESKLWKFGWSIFTTTIGIVLLLTLRALILVMIHSYTTASHSDYHHHNHQHSNSHSSSTTGRHMKSVQKELEQYVATGTLWGVSIAWIFTDFILEYSIPSSSSSVAAAAAGGRGSGYSNNTIISYWYVPILISAFSLFGWHSIVGFVHSSDSTGDDDDDDDTTTALRTPLLVTDVNELPLPQTVATTPPQVNNNNNSSRKHRTATTVVQLLSFGVGGIIGILIQCSTFGVTYIGQFISYNRTILHAVLQQQSTTTTLEEQQHQSVDITTTATMATAMYDSVNTASLVKDFERMTIGISFIISGVGLILLLFIRALIIHLIHHDTDDNDDNDMDKKADTTDAFLQNTTVCEETTSDERMKQKSIQNNNTASSSSSSSSSLKYYNPLQTFVLLHVESFLATGTVVGLNLAWMVTDYCTYILIPPEEQQPCNSSTYWIQSFVTFLISTSWCPFVLYCTGVFSSYTKIIHNNYNDDDDETNKRHSSNDTTDGSTTDDELIPSVNGLVSIDIPVMTTTSTTSRYRILVVNDDEETAYM